MAGRRAKVVLLCRDRVSSRIVYHALSEFADIVCVVVEQPVPAAQILRRRAARLGYRKTLGQLLFALANRGMRRLSRRRIDRLIAAHRLCADDFTRTDVVAVTSVNEARVSELLQSSRPDAVVVNGTRIIARPTLAAGGAPFINIHLGITPQYRGAHGAYWALVNDDAAHCGVSVHLIDDGIDTGAVLYQSTIAPGRDDDINTYPIHQIAAALPLLQTALADVVGGAVRARPSAATASALWQQPTLFEYLYYWRATGVR